MAQLAPARARICRVCDGFAAAVITTGTRHHDGTRATLRVTCPACQGTGHRAPARRRETARV
ncbi:hypothetical protein ACH4Y0_11505 [Streptomyces sp. NPDC020707]|uniref:hypothetical protein n=1 Tax=Streptomyces sp. NPDC020707 TaxID=3365084 RepID=UPI00378BDFDB